MDVSCPRPLSWVDLRKPHVPCTGEVTVEIDHVDVVSNDGAAGADCWLKVPGLGAAAPDRGHESPSEGGPDRSLRRESMIREPSRRTAAVSALFEVAALMRCRQHPLGSVTTTTSWWIAECVDSRPCRALSVEGYRRHRGRRRSSSWRSDRTGRHSVLIPFVLGPTFVVDGCRATD